MGHAVDLGPAAGPGGQVDAAERPTLNDQRSRTYARAAAVVVLGVRDLDVGVDVVQVDRAPRLQGDGAVDDAVLSTPEALRLSHDLIAVPGSRSRHRDRALGEA